MLKSGYISGIKLTTLKRNSVIFTLTILLLFFVSACTSSKNADKNFVSRSLDDLIARDNGYFNARLIMKETEQTLWNEQVENYDETLPIFKYGTQEQAAAVQPSMDEVIKKTSFVIQMHKKSKWVDDSYFLIGKSHFYKRSYDEALISFQYIISEYSNIIEKQSKSKRIVEDEDGELTFLEKLKHQPVSSEAGIWVARTLVEKGKYSDAHTVISVLKSRENFPKWLLGELYAVEADCYMKEGQSQNAIIPLELAVKNTEGKLLTSRYNFILAQLYASQKLVDKSLATYKIVIENKPTYDMDFYAKLNIAKLSLSNYGISGSETKADLMALLEDEKYKDFYGLIYYTLADIALASKQKELGVDYLNMSLRSTNDGRQKGLSYLLLGDINYADLNYKNAYAYYDSTVTNLPREHERHAEVKSLRDNLKLLVDELDIIETEKKLQYWASLSEKDLAKELEKLIPEKETDDSVTSDFTNGAVVNALNANPAEGDFYFYNTNLRSRGFSEFKKRWGTRKLEDNWRRSEKGSFGEDGEVAEEIIEEKTIDLSGKDVTTEKIIAGLPKTPEQINASNAKIAGALYRAGLVYKENFKNKVKAIEMFEENVNQYPDNANEVQALYQLYRLTNNPNQDKYKNLLLTKYPESDYAKVISDPDYFKREEERKNALEIYYAATYDMLEKKNYSAVKARVAATDSLFKVNPLKPKFEMLNALADADSVDLFKNSLQKIALKYPEQEVGIRAQEMLDYLRRGSVLEDAGKTVFTASYTYNETEEHFFMFVMNGTGKNATTMKSNIATFNATSFSIENLKISSLLLGKENSIILVKSFVNIEKAMIYYFAVKDNPGVFTDLTKDAFVPMVISKSNYVQFFKVKDVEGYDVFFQESYLNE